MIKQSVQRLQFLTVLLPIMHGQLAHADELHFPGGDLLVGNYIRTEEGRIVFDTRVVGRISVAEAEVKLVRTGAPLGLPGQPLAVLVAEAQGSPSAGVEPVVAPEVAQAGGGLTPLDTDQAREEETRELATAQSLVYRMLSYVNPFKGWHSKISFGYIWENTGVTTQDMTLIWDAERKGDGSDFKFSARYDYGTRKTGDDPKELARDRLRGDFRYREDIGRRFFFEANANYDRDRIKAIRHEFRQNAGIGWRVLRGESLTATLVPKITLRYREFDTYSEGWEFLATLSQDIRYRINERMVFIQAASASWNPDEFTRSTYELTLRLENRITERVFVDLAFEYEFDYEADVGIESKSQRLVVLVGYKF